VLAHLFPCVAGLVVYNVNFSRLWFLRSGGQESTEDDYTKGLIVSFTAKRIGASDETEKAADAADAADTEGGDEEEKLSREDIKGGLTKFGIIRVGFHSLSHLTAACSPCT